MNIVCNVVKDVARNILVLITLLWKIF